MTADAKLHFGGIPVAPDVKRIRDEWPDETLTEGQIISDADMETVIGCRKSHDRYQTVTQKWRKTVEMSCGAVIGREPGVGFKVLSDSEKLQLQEGKVKSSFRAMRRSRDVSIRIDRNNLSDDERKRQDFLDRKAAAGLLVLQTKSIAQLPQLD